MSIFNRLRKQDQKISDAKEASAETSSKEGKAVKPSKSDDAPKKGDKSKKAETPAKQKKKIQHAAVYSVLTQPIITEKATLSGTYVFEVASKANKAEVKKAVELLYGVTPEHVRIMNVKGKTIRWNARQGKRQDWKKAIVRLKKGETINVYEGT